MTKGILSEEGIRVMEKIAERDRRWMWGIVGFFIGFCVAVVVSCL